MNFYIVIIHVLFGLKHSVQPNRRYLENASVRVLLVRSLCMSLLLLIKIDRIALRVAS